MQNCLQFSGIYSTHRSSVSNSGSSPNKLLLGLDRPPGFLPTPPKCTRLRSLSYTWRVSLFSPVPGCITPHIPDALPMTPLSPWVFPVCSLQHHAGIYQLFFCVVCFSLLDYEHLEPGVLHLYSSQCLDVHTHRFSSVECLSPFYVIDFTLQIVSSLFPFLQKGFGSS